VARLLYVATTRAKTSLHLIAFVEHDEKDQSQLKKTLKGSFFELLWSPCHQQIYDDIKVIDEHTQSNLTENSQPTSLTRLVNYWQLPIHNVNLPLREDHAEGLNHPILSAKNQRHLGTVVHEALENIANEGIAQWNQARINKMKIHWQRRLTQLSVLPIHLKENLALIIQAVNNTLTDEKGQWILANHQEQQNEYSLSAIINNIPTHTIIDRTFVENGVRWIIDYKTATPNDESTEEFLNRQQQKYTEQLNHYAQAFALLEQQPIKLGLYFPLCSAWCEWDYS